MMCMILHLGASPAGELVVVEHVGDLVDLIRSEDLIVILPCNMVA